MPRLKITEIGVKMQGFLFWGILFFFIFLNYLDLKQVFHFSWPQFFLRMALIVLAATIFLKKKVENGGPCVLYFGIFSLFYFAFAPGFSAGDIIDLQMARVSFLTSPAAATYVRMLPNILVSKLSHNLPFYILIQAYLFLVATYFFLKFFLEKISKQLFSLSLLFIVLNPFLLSILLLHSPHTPELFFIVTLTFFLTLCSSFSYRKLFFYIFFASLMVFARYNSVALIPIFLLGIYYIGFLHNKKIKPFIYLFLVFLLFGAWGSYKTTEGKLPYRYQPYMYEVVNLNNCVSSLKAELEVFDQYFDYKKYSSPFCKIKPLAKTFNDELVFDILTNRSLTEEQRTKFEAQYFKLAIKHPWEIIKIKIKVWMSFIGFSSFYDMEPYWQNKPEHLVSQGVDLELAKKIGYRFDYNNLNNSFLTPYFMVIANSPIRLILMSVFFPCFVSLIIMICFFYKKMFKFEELFLAGSLVYFALTYFVFSHGFLLLHALSFYVIGLPLTLRLISTIIKNLKVS